MAIQRNIGALLASILLLSIACSGNTMRRIGNATEDASSEQANRASSEEKGSLDEGGAPAYDYGHAPMPITATNLADLDSTRARCDHRGPVNGAFEVQCIAVAIDEHNQELPVTGLAPYVSLSWKLPVSEGEDRVTYRECIVSKNTLRQDCTIKLSNSTVSQKLRVILEIAKHLPNEAAKKREEFDIVELPFSIETIGQPRHMPYLGQNLVMSPPLGGSANLGLASTNAIPNVDVTWNFATSNFPKTDFAFDAVNAICSRDGQTFIANDHIIYRVQGERTYYFAGTTNRANAFEVSHARRVYLDQIRRLTCRKSSIVVHDSGCRFIEIFFDGTTRVIYDDRAGGTGQQCQYGFSISAIAPNDTLYFIYEPARLAARRPGQTWVHAVENSVVGEFTQAKTDTTAGPNFGLGFLDLASDDALNYFYTQDKNSGKVWRMNASGAVEHVAFTNLTTGLPFAEGMDAKSYKAFDHQTFKGIPKFAFGKRANGESLLLAIEIEENPSQKSRVLRIDAEGKLTKWPIADGTRLGGAAFAKLMLDINAEGFLLATNVSSNGASTIVKLTSVGVVEPFAGANNLIVEADSASDGASLKFGPVFGLSFDSQGNLYFADSLLGSVHLIDATNKNTVLINANQGPAPGSFLFPTGLLAGADNSLYIYDSSVSQVKLRRFDLQTKSLTDYVTGATCSFNSAHLINGNIGDGGPVGSACIMPTSDNLRSWGAGIDTTLSIKGWYGRATPGMVLDHSGSIIIADFYVGRVRAINPETQVITTLIGNLNAPWSAIGQSISEQVQRPKTGPVNGADGKGIGIAKPGAITVAGDNAIFFSNGELVYRLSPDRATYSYWLSPKFGGNFNDDNMVTSLAALPNGALLAVMDYRQMVLTVPNDVAPGERLPIKSLVVGDTLARDCGAGPVRNAALTGKLVKDISAGLSRICSGRILGMAQSGKCVNPDDEFKLAFAVAYSLNAGGATIVKMSVKCSALLNGY